MRNGDRAPSGPEITAARASVRRSGPRHASSRRFWGHAALVTGAVTALTIGLGSGAAWAYFTATGTGAGAGTVGHLDPLILVGTGTTSGPLFPGKAADLHLEVTNPNNHPVTITSLAQSGTVVVTGAIGCTAGTATLTVTSAAPDITVSSGRSPVTIPAGVSMGTSSTTACQTAIFRIPLTVTVRS